MSRPSFRALSRVLRHAFAVEPSNRVEATPEEMQTVDRLCAEILRRRLQVPAQMLLELARPLNYVAAQSLHGLTPLVGSLVGEQRVRGLAEFLEQRGSIDYLLRRLDELEKQQASSHGQPPPVSELSSQAEQGRAAARNFSTTE